MKQLTLQDKFHALSPGTRAAALVIFILSLAAYSGSFHAGFHFDDINQILENRHVRDIGNVPRFFADAALASGIPGRIGYRPVTFSTYAVNYAIGGYGVSGFHIVNFMLHVLNALMVFLVTGAVLKKTGADSPGLPLASALIFALHPVQTSAVTYVSGRSALLASLFCLLSLYSFIRLREAGARPARYAWWAASLAFFVLGLLSKEMAVSALGLMAAYQVIVEGPEKAGDRGPVPVLYIPYAAVLALY
ncbi:MAG TPA: hypothetical protein VJM83_05165, partial [Nitrospirota bacterium]|nr:hypothetical protein [Nitrospirota bacterium]